MVFINNEYLQLQFVFVSSTLLTCMCIYAWEQEAGCTLSYSKLKSFPDTNRYWPESPEQTFIYSKSTTETLEKVMKYVQS